MKNLFFTLVLLSCSVIVFAQVPTESYFNDKKFTQYSVTCISPEGSTTNTQSVCNQVCESSKLIGSRLVGFTTSKQNKMALWADGRASTWSYTTGNLTIDGISFTDVKLTNGKLVVKTAGANGYTCIFTYNVYDPNVVKANPNDFKQPKPAFK